MHVVCWMACHTSRQIKLSTWICLNLPEILAAAKEAQSNAGIIPVPRVGTPSEHAGRNADSVRTLHMRKDLQQLPRSHAA